MNVWLLLVLILLCWAGFTWFFLRGRSLSAYDQPYWSPHTEGQHLALRSASGQSGSEYHQILKELHALTTEAKKLSQKEQLTFFRNYMDDQGKDVAFNGEIRPATVAYSDQQGESISFKGEWLIPEGANTNRRFLYIHGGAFTMGSPLSHRNITTELARIIGGAVFSLDYRLLPENHRFDGIQDCRWAYEWLLSNGPDGASDVELIYISGDSAGGNLTLSLVNWVRDKGLRAPDAVVALAPATDACGGSPSLSKNIKTDPLLGPTFGPLTRLPYALYLWVSWAYHRTRPNVHEVSPIYADLSGLPPILIQASDSEMLWDDAQRYANKAIAEGSPVFLQNWHNTFHVWHIFLGRLPEAREAFDSIEIFLQEQGNLPH